MMMQGMNVGAVIGNLLGRQLAYPYNFRRYLDDLKEQVEKLKDARERHLRFVEEAEWQGDEISPDDGKWLAHAEEKIRQAEALIEDEMMTKNKCFNGLCPDLKSRYELGKKAMKLTDDIVKIREANDFGGVSRNSISIASTAEKDLTVLDYLLQYKSNIAGLMEQDEKLRNAWQRVQGSVDEARGQGNEIFLDVQKWLIRAEEMIQKVEKLKEEGQSTNNRCFNGRYLNLMSRYQLSKEAKKLAGLLVKIIQETHNFDRVSFPPPPTGIWSATLESRMPISIASRPAEYLLALITGRLHYLLQYKSNIAGLMEQVEKLGNAWQRLQVSVDEARRQGQEIFPFVSKWLMLAEEMIRKAERFIEDETKTSKSCFRLSLMYKPRSMEAKKQAKDIAHKVDEAYHFNRVSYQLPPKGKEAELVQDYEALESRMWILNEIMDALRDDELNMIGIWGMVGVGKTILAEQVDIQARENMLFDEVVRVQVSHTPSLMDIQEKIASKLGLRLEQENESLRAHRLYERLKKKNRILIILDDIWAELDLRKVGIPWGDDHPGCKIVLTSRDLFVLSNEMATQRNFRVQHLSEEEAWRLFEKTAGDSIEKPDLRSIAIEVAKECAGLPSAVVSIAKALKHEDPAMWKQTLQQLRRSIMTSIGEFSKKLYSTANLSYIHLNNDEIKSLLLLCGLIANDAGTDVLLEYVIGLALFEGVNTLEEATNRLQSLLQDLRSASLLLGGEDDKRVIMHGVLRDLAIEIASRERHWLVREDVPSEEWSKTDEIEIATEDDHWLARGVRLEEWSKTDEAAECISLNLRHIHELPDERLVCPKLKIFRLSCKGPYLEIRTNFFEFEGMKELQVLDLSGMHFLSLPSSLGFLQNLRTLRLHKCALKNISMISKLTKLEVLSLVHSNVSKFPREMAQLTRLRLLDLCNCSQLKEIPYNTISKFSQLEKLCMENSFTQWEVDGDNASVAELKLLSQLIILDVKIPDASLLPKEELLENLMRFRIFIGDVWDWYKNYETSRTLKLNKFDTGLHLVDGISKLLKRTEDLCLRELSGTKNLLNLDREGFRELQYLHVQNSPEIQFIINSVDGLPADGAFPVLKSLLLDNLIRLEGVCHGRLPVGSFCNLRFLTIENCSSLLTVAPPNLLPGLQNLEVLDVRACNLLKEVFNFEGLDTHNVHVGRLPKLKELKLIDLPELKHICKKGLPRTEEITVQEGAEEAVEDFPELTSLSLESLPSLSSFYNLRRPGIPIPALFDERVSLSPQIPTFMLCMYPCMFSYSKYQMYFI